MTNTKHCPNCHMFRCENILDINGRHEYCDNCGYPNVRKQTNEKFCEDADSSLKFLKKE